MDSISDKTIFWSHTYTQKHAPLCRQHDKERCYKYFFKCELQKNLSSSYFASFLHNCCYSSPPPRYYCDDDDEKVLSLGLFTEWKFRQRLATNGGLSHLSERATSIFYYHCAMLYTFLQMIGILGMLLTFFHVFSSSYFSFWTLYWTYCEWWKT